MSDHHRRSDRYRHLRLCTAAFLGTLALTVVVACGGDDDTSDDTTTTSQADDSGADDSDAEGADNSSSSSSPDASDESLPPIMPADELEDELATAVEDGDACAFNAVVNTANLSPESGSVDEFKASYAVAADAATAISEKAPAEVADALSKLADTARAVVEILDGNGGDVNDPAITELQSSEDNTAAQNEYGAWVTENCEQGEAGGG